MSNSLLMDALGSEVGFRALLDTDEKLVLSWRNSDAVAPFMYSDHLIADKEHHIWFESARYESPNYIHRLICVNGEPVGLLSITSIDYEMRSCVWAFYIASEKARGFGVGQITEWWVIEHAFEVLGLNRISCEVLVSNENVIRMHESFGFRRESFLRERCWKSGVPLDAVGLSLLKSDWQQLKFSIAQKPRIAAYIG